MLSSDTISFRLPLRTCVVMKCPCPLSHGTGSPKFLNLGKEKISSRWKTGSKLAGQGICHSGCLRMPRPFVVKSVLTIPELDRAVTDSEVEEVNVNNESQSRSRRVPLEHLKEIDPRNYEWRLKISKARKWMVPWNKGKKLSPEIIARIREGTKLAMQDLKVRGKLGGTCQPHSEETKKKIGLSVRSVACKKKKMRETCLLAWEESVAEAARIGGDGEDELQWDSYEILKEKIRQDYLRFAEMRKKEQRTPKSAEQKKKISEAIRAKWADPEFRQRVQAGWRKYRENRQPPTRRVTIKQTPKVDAKLPSCKTKIKTETEIKTKTKAKPKTKTPANTLTKMPAELSENEELLENYRMKSPDPYSDPLASAKLVKIKQLRENRETIERRKREAVEWARLLIAEAEKAAQALEAAAVTDDTARTSLFETRKLLAEAVQALKSVQPDICGNEHTLIKGGDILEADAHMNSCHMAASATLGLSDGNGTPKSPLARNNHRQNNYDNYKCAVQNFLNCRLSGSIFDYAKKQPSHSTEIDEENFFNYASRLFSTSDLSADGTNHSFNLKPDKSIEKDSMSYSEDASTPTLIALKYAGMVREPIVANTAEKHMSEHMKDNSLSIATNYFTCKGPIQSSIGVSKSRSLQNDSNDPLASNKGCKKVWVCGKLVEVERD